LKKRYRNLNFSIKEENYDIAYFILSDYNFTGIEEKLDEIVFTIDEDDYNHGMEIEIIEKIKQIGVDISFSGSYVIDDKNWNEEYEKKAKPIKVNDRISITPSWRESEINSEIKIIINPKMSFGTGEHSTTKLVCRLMDGNIQNGSSWIDVGTGTGVLAILAAKLGAKSVYAFDNNEWSVDNALENIKNNGTDNIVKIEQSDIDNMVLPPSDGIVANLFRHLVISSFAQFYKSLKNNDSQLIISGIMTFDKDEVIENAINNNFELIEHITEDEWIAFRFKPKGK
jgi:ribosomal protein L11 methyltransferase